MECEEEMKMIRPVEPEWLRPLVVGKKPGFNDVPVSAMVETAAEYPKLFETEHDLASFLGCVDDYSTKDLLGGAVRDALPQFETIDDLVYCAYKFGVVPKSPGCDHSVLARVLYPWNKHSMKECAFQAFVGVVNSVQIPDFFGPMVIIVIPSISEALWSGEKQTTVGDLVSFSAYQNFVSLINGEREKLSSLLYDESPESKTQGDADPVFISLSGTIPTVSRKEKKEEGKSRAPPVKTASSSPKFSDVKYPGKGEKPHHKRSEKGTVPEKPSKGVRPGGKGKESAKPPAAYQPMAYSSRPRIHKTFEKAVVNKQSVFKRPHPPPKGSSEW